MKALLAIAIFALGLVSGLLLPKLMGQAITIKLVHEFKLPPK